MNIVSRKMTGRGWGDKKPFAIIRRFKENDKAAVECEADFWCGPCEAGERGQYERVRWIETAPYAGGSCSFDSQLRAALPCR